MSRIGKAIIEIPSDVTVDFKNDIVIVKGKNGELSQRVTQGISLDIKGKTLIVNKTYNSKKNTPFHGLYRALINNMVKGVSEGFTTKLELVGVGYRASNQGQKLEMSLGFSHGVVLELPKEISVETFSEKGKNPIIILKSNDKQLLGMIAAKIRSLRNPEPYKGKGIKFVGEVIRRKAGKSVK